VNSTAKQIARARIHVLFQQAARTYKTNPELAQNYVLTAKKIGMSARLCIPTVYKRSVCNDCNSLLVPGETSRVRLQPRREPHVVVTCLRCGGQTRIPLKPKRKEKLKSEQNINQDETSR
jgi:ribonuclease P protein subunit RPR2